MLGTIKESIKVLTWLASAKSENRFPKVLLVLKSFLELSIKLQLKSESFPSNFHLRTQSVVKGENENK